MTDEKLGFKDILGVKLKGPDGKVKEERHTKKKYGRGTKLLAILLLIPVVIYLLGRKLISRLKHL